MSDNDIQLIGQAICQRREFLGMTQEKAAEAAGLDVGHYSKIERGLKTPSMASLFRIAEALEIGPGELLPSTNTKSTSQAVTRGIQDLLSQLSDEQAISVLRAIRILLTTNIPVE